MQQLYTITVDCEGKLFCSNTRKWDYCHWTVDVSIPEYIQTALQWFKHPIPTSEEHALHAYLQP
eukprot:7424380-Ditylum_brightwellii.AAC.1